MKGEFHMGIAAMIKSMIMAAIMAFQMSTKVNRLPEPYTFKTERCTALSNHELMSPDGHIFEINNNILVEGYGYWVLFDTYNTRTRVDDEIVDFDEKLYWKWVKFL